LFRKERVPKLESTDLIQAIRNTWTILCRAERKRAVLLQFGSIILSLADIFFLVSLLAIINFYLSEKSSLPFYVPAFLKDRHSLQLITWFGVLFTFKNVAGYFLTRAQDDFCAGVATRISAIRMQQYQLSDYQQFVEVDSSSWMRRIALEPFEFSQQIISGLQQMLTQVMLVLFAMIALVIFNSLMFLSLLVILLPLSMMVFYLVRKRTAELKSQVRHHNEKSYQYMLDALKGYVEANVYHRNEFFLHRFMKERTVFARSLFRANSVQAFPARVIEIFAILGLLGMMIFARWTDQKGLLLTIGAFMAAAYKIIPGIVKIINLGGQVRSFPFSEGWLLPAIPVKEKNPGPVSSIEFENVSFNYGSTAVLSGLNFSVSKGELLGIRGASGRGKTTLLNILLGFLPPTKGLICINNKAMDAAALRALWPSYAYVKQQPFFIHDTILKNITLKDEPVNQQLFDCSALITGLDQLIKAFPEGHQKIVMENGKNLSGGQQQRVSITRALYNSPQVLLLDEPFNELDGKSSEYIMHGIRQWAREGHIVLLVTHEPAMLAYCDKTIAVDG
jgi:ABC-type bacteriocin/lantibiotic exporter with double-glycine peptidase domain